MKIHKLSKKPQRDAGIWFRVSESLFRNYGSNPLNLIRECNHDALRIYNKKLSPAFKHRFPYLSGNKIFPLWIRMLHDNVGIDLVNMEHVPIPVDVHIARATFATGCLVGEYMGTISDVSPRVDEAWRKAVEAVKHDALKYRLQLDEPLWHLSKYGCRFRRGNFCPKRARCPVSASCVDGAVNVSAEGVEVETSD